jgi:hypothetical protein
MNGSGNRPTPLGRSGNSDPGCEYFQNATYTSADFPSLKHDDRLPLPSSLPRESLGTTRFQAFPA